MSEAWSRLVNVAGVFGGAVALVYLIGAVSLSLRYEGLGLPSHLAASVTPREVLLAAGLRTLAIWAALGLAGVYALSRLSDAAAERLARPLSSWPAWAAAGVVVVVLLLVLRVWWPLALLGAVLAIVAVGATRKPAFVRLVVGTLAATLVAAAYEADRLSYLVEWTCVRTADARPCGPLVGQQERGFYLALPVGGSHRLGFIPASRVESAEADKQPAQVVERYAERRRERLVSRLVNIRPR